jgi:hypothetical protein
MAIVQISKMQMRRGSEIDLPGAPTSLTPLTFGPGLLSGEFCFAVDTGRLFIGHDPNSSQANYQRTDFPYRNLEILTENSTQALNRAFGRARQAVDEMSFLSATLVPEMQIWRDVEVIRQDGSTRSFMFSGAYLLASVDYFVYSSSGIPVRQGTLRIASEENIQEAAITDSSVSTRRNDLTGPDRDDVTKIYENVYFKVARIGLNPTLGYKFQYKNSLSEPVKLMFNVTRPQP